MSLSCLTDRVNRERTKSLAPNIHTDRTYGFVYVCVMMFAMLVTWCGPTQFRTT